MKTVIPKPARQSSIDDSLVPMINIVFLLLIFFMISGQFMLPVAAEVSPPESEALEPLQLSEIVISQDKNGAVYINAKAVSDISAALNELELSGDSVVLLALARDMEARHLDPLMRELQARGVEKLRLVTQEQQQ